jgi:hypothetical protein
MVASATGKIIVTTMENGMRKKYAAGCGIVLAALMSGCTTSKTDSGGKFADDVAFMKKHTQVVTLQSGDAAVAVAPAYQGRVMTSTFDKDAGPSFGWINRPVIAKGILPPAETKGKLEEHIYIFGGEERFWLGPEGGQYALYFAPGATFDFANWKTPAVIDTEPFELVAQKKDGAVFRHDCELTNYSGFTFKMGIERTVRLMDKATVEESLGTTLADGVKMVAFETENLLTNRGEKPWLPETGLPSIWLLGMLNPAPKTTVVIPLVSGSEDTLGSKVNDTYFGKVPPDYLKVEKDVVFFKGDGTRRGKIGVSDRRSKGMAGSYDPDGQVLTIVTYNQQPAQHGFVNSMWEQQKQPYAGDVINSYNDGSPEPGKPPLGPFYELETSSPAAALKPGETMKHVQRMFHFYGSEKDLNPLACKLLGASLEEINSAFQQK